MKDQAMKLDAILQATEAQTLRRFEVKNRNKARKRGEHTGKVNYPMYSIMREDAYFARMELRVAARHLHLARAFLNDQSYFQVENTVRENNEPSADVISFVLSHYGYEVAPHFVEKWLNEEAA